MQPDLSMCGFVCAGYCNQESRPNAEYSTAKRAIQQHASMTKLTYENISASDMDMKLEKDKQPWSAHSLKEGSGKF